MKKINPVIRDFLVSLIFITGINQVTDADPYMALCIGTYCQYYNVPLLKGMCTNDSLKIYATNPKSPIPCFGTRQWYTKEWCLKLISPGLALWGYWPVAIEGATSNTYTVKDPGPYWCDVDCGSGVYQTDTVEFIYYSSSPVISSQPESQNICMGDDVTFSLNANDVLNYQWRKKLPGGDWINIEDAISDSYSYTPLALENSSKFQCVVSNGCGTIYSNEATLTINSLPVVNLGADMHICDGSELVLDAGAGFAQYSWSTGENTRTITVITEDNYFVTVTDNNNCSKSDNIMIYVDPNIPSLDLGNDRIICPGGSVKLNAGSGYDTYNWSTGANVQSLVITDEGNYSVQASINGNVCIVYDTVQVSFTKPYEDEEIGLVTIDFQTGDNLVVWERTLNKGTDYYKVYRGSEGNELYLGSVNFADPTVFHDIGTWDDGLSYRYKITVVDTCGTESSFSNSHKTMHLTASVGVAGEVNLAWNHYEGFPVAWYYIHRGIDSADLHIYDSIQYDPTTMAKTDYNPPAGVAYYRIGVKAPKVYYATASNKKVDSGPYSQSMSNIEDNRLKTGFKTLKSTGDLLIYPNPANDFITIRFPNPEQSEYQLVVRDLTGKIVLIINNIIEDKIIIQRGKLKPGYYLVEATGKEIHRGKIIVE